MEVGKNTFYHGDCLFVLRHDISPESVDLIYLDPPFFTGQVQKGIRKWQPEAMEISFEDTKGYWSRHLDAMRLKAPIWLGDVGNKRPEFAAYLYYMMERLQGCHRVLKKTGSIYLHCDYRASHYLKHVMDDIFEHENFRNEIVWCYTGPRKTPKAFSRKHEIIFFYSKTPNYKFNQLTIPHKSGIHDTGQVETFGGLREGQISQEQIEGIKKLEQRGKVLEDWWIDIWATERYRSELVGYPTQKPEALLKRIILASSNEEDLVLDPFCGCGTTAIAASKLNRRFIGIDIDPTAFQVIKNRSHELFNQSRYISRYLKEVLKMASSDFEKWVNEFYEANKPHPDRGVDGITPNGVPIQVKTFRIGYEVIDKLLTSSKYHPHVPKPIKKVIVVSQTGFDDTARQRKFEIENTEGIEVCLTTPEEMLKLET